MSFLLWSICCSMYQGDAEVVDQNGSRVTFSYCSWVQWDVFHCSFPTMLCRRAEWGNWLGSGLFQNILAVARKRGKLSFTKLCLWNWIGWEQDGLAAPAQVHAYNKDHPYTAAFLTVRTHLKDCHWDQLEVRLHLLVKGEAGMVENINETHHDPKNGRPWLARRKK